MQPPHKSSQKTSPSKTEPAPAAEGLGGWMLFPMILLAFTISICIGNLVQLVGKLWGSSAIVLAEQNTLETWGIDLPLILTIAVIANSLLLIFGTVMIVLAIKRHYMFRWLLIAHFALFVVCAVLVNLTELLIPIGTMDTTAAMSVLGLSELLAAGISLLFAQYAVYCGLFTIASGYLILSTRASNTFKRRNLRSQRTPELNNLDLQE